MACCDPCDASEVDRVMEPAAEPVETSGVADGLAPMASEEAACCIWSVEWAAICALEEVCGKMLFGEVPLGVRVKP